MKYGSKQWIFFQKNNALGFSTTNGSQAASTINMSSNTAKPNDGMTKTSFEEIGTLVGGAYAAGLYSLTAPITLLDGPLPLVDAAWLAGLGFATVRGANYGRRAGRVVDEVIDYVN